MYMRGKKRMERRKEIGNEGFCEGVNVVAVKGNFFEFQRGKDASWTTRANCICSIVGLCGIGL